MKKKSKVWIGILILVILAAVIVFRFASKKEVVEENTVPTVSVQLPENRSIFNYGEAIGTLEPMEEVDVLPKMSGEITEVHFAIGDRVEKDQVLVSIHSDALDSLRIGVDTARIAMTDAQTALSRTQALFATGAVSQQQLESAQSAAKSTQLAFKNAETQLKLQSGYTEVKAPIAGIIETKNVSEHDQASPAAPVCTISGEGGISVSFSVAEGVRKNLSAGDAIEVVKGSESFKGSISEISEKISAQSGLYSCKASVSGNSAALTSGSKAKVIMTADSRENVMTIPMAAVMYNDGAAYIYCFRDNKAEKVDIETGLFDDTYIEVVSGLTGDDQVIVSWSSEIYNGAEVNAEAEDSAE